MQIPSPSSSSSGSSAISPSPSVSTSLPGSESTSISFAVSTKASLQKLPFALSSTVKVSDTVSPAAMSPIFQIPLTGSKLPSTKSVSMKLNPLAISSLTVTPVARLGPTLFTVRVKVMRSPTVPSVAEADFSSERSITACGVISTQSLSSSSEVAALPGVESASC